MEYNVSELNPKYDFIIHGASFVGSPQSGTFMFVTKRVKRLIVNLKDIKNCLIFVEEGLDIPSEYAIENCIIFAEDPQLAYAEFAIKAKELDNERERSRKYTLTPEGYYLGENVSLGNNVIIEQGCRIGHDVTIGDDSFIGYGSTIYNTEIGKGFRCLDRTSIGIDAFYMADGETRFRIPSFGKVIIGNNVELSSGVTVERGFNSNTIIKDNTKIDSNVCLGHDDILGENVIITSGASIAGLVTIGDNAYIGMNATIKQRLNIGNNAMVGMGAVVIANVKEDVSVFGNPAKKFGI